MQNIEQTPNEPDEWGPLTKLAAEVRLLARGMDREQARALVDLYYRWQEHRISLGNQRFAAAKDEAPTLLMDHFFNEASRLERQVVSVLDVWSDAHPLGEWAKAQVGIGPVLAAGLLAHVDHTRLETAGQLWRFAGLDPSVSWGKGEKRPWNADLKLLTWKISTSFVRQSFRESCFYGALYKERKVWETAKNDRGDNAGAAFEVLASKNIRAVETRAAYESGKLPPGHVDARARRWVAKLFLAHYFEVGYRVEHGTPAPKPYVISHLGHAHEIKVPGPIVWSP